MSWNGFSCNLTNKLIHVFTSRVEMNNNTTHADAGHTDSIPTEQLPTIWMRLPFIGKHGNILKKKFTKKTRRLLKGPCKFVINWRTTNYNCFLSCKDKTPDEYKSSVVYEFSCPGCRSSYIGKTDLCVYTRIKEHSNSRNVDSIKQLSKCQEKINSLLY